MITATADSVEELFVILRRRQRSSILFKCNRFIHGPPEESQQTLIETFQQASFVTKASFESSSETVMLVMLRPFLSFVNLTDVTFTRCKFSIPTAHLLKESLPKAKGLRKLSFKYSELNTIDIASLIFSSLADTEGIEDLDLYHTFIGTDRESNKVANYLRYFIDSTDSLKKIDLEYCYIKDKFLMKILPSLMSAVSLATLDLSNNAISDSGFSALFSALQNNISVERLYLTDAGNVKKSIKGLCSMIRKNRRIKFLFLNALHIGDAAFGRISEAMLSNRTLLEVFFINNQISRKSEETICRLLCENLSLVGIVLEVNPLTLLNSSPILTALKNNYELQRFEIETANSAVQNKIQAIIERNKEIKKQKIRTSILHSKETVYWNRCKLLVVGEGRAGKSATVRSLLNYRFLTNSKSTEGADIYRITVPLTNQLWKDSTSEDNNIAASLLAQTVIQEEALAKELFTKKKINHNGNDNKAADENNHSVLGEVEETKTHPVLGDVEDEDVLPGTQKIINEVIEKKFLANTENNLEQSIEYTLWDFGGQEVFFSLHQLFLSGFGHYLLLVDLSKFLKIVQLCLPEETVSKRIQRRFQRNSDSSTKEDLMQCWTRHENMIFATPCVKNFVYWLRSIELFTPDTVVFLVGSFFDVIKTKQRLAQIDSLLQFVVQRSIDEVTFFNENDDTIFTLFPISNKSKKGIDRLRNRIYVQSSQLLQNEALRVPKKSLLVLDALFELEENDFASTFVMLEHFCNICAKHEIVEEREVDDLLRLFRDRGVIVWFESISSLKNIIILSPQKLLNAVSTLIKDERCHFQEDAKISAIIPRDNLLEDFIAWETKGLLSKDLSVYLLQRAFESSIVTNNHCEIILALMQETLLITRFGTSDDFIIPSMLPKIQHPQEFHSDDQITFSITVTLRENGKINLLPQSLSEKVFCLFLHYIHTECTSVTAKLYKDSFHALFKREENSDISIEVLVNKANSDKELRVSVSPSTSVEYISGLLTAIFSKINVEFLKQHLEWTYKGLDLAPKLVLPVEEEFIIQSMDLRAFLEN